MRILTISNAAWDDRNAVGNTQSNWFSEWPNVEICSMYTREAEPNNKCCHYYYQVTITDIIRHFFSWNKIGRSFTHLDSLQKSARFSSEEKVVTSVHGWKRTLLQMAVEIVYSSKIWFNKKTKQHIVDFNPDVVFCFAIAEPFRYSILEFVKRHTHAKIVTWIADDVIGQTSSMLFFSRWIYRKRYRHLFDISDKIYGVSQMLCDEYSLLFNINIRPLYKGCFFAPCKTAVNKPIQFIYAGNLYYGRDRTLSKLASIIKDVNKDSCKAQLSIYSTTEVSKDVSEQLNIEGSSQLCGSRPYSEISRLMSKADIVLHVESFSADQVKEVRLSFSTKIIDCLQSGSTLMVIGPQGIASVEYLRTINGVIIVDDLTKLHIVIEQIVNNPDQLVKRAQQINDYAVEKHKLSSVRAELRGEFQSLIQS